MRSILLCIAVALAVGGCEKRTNAPSVVKSVFESGMEKEVGEARIMQFTLDLWLREVLSESRIDSLMRLAGRPTVEWHPFSILESMSSPGLWNEIWLSRNLRTKDKIRERIEWECGIHYGAIIAGTKEATP